MTLGEKAYATSLRLRKNQKTNYQRKNSHRKNKRKKRGLLSSPLEEDYFISQPKKKSFADTFVKRRRGGKKGKGRSNLLSIEKRGGHSHDSASDLRWIT